MSWAWGENPSRCAARSPGRGQEGGRGAAPKHVAKFSGERCKLRGVAPVGREREGRALNCEGDAADEELGAVGERSACISEAGMRVGGPGGLDRGGERGGQGGATRDWGPLLRPAERWDGAKAGGAEKRA